MRYVRVGAVEFILPIQTTDKKGNTVNDVIDFYATVTKYENSVTQYQNKDVGNIGLDTLSGMYDEVVVAAGAWTSQLVPQCNIYPIKGYTVTLWDESRSAPEYSIIDDGKKIVTSTFSNGRFRVAGTAELAGFENGEPWNRITPLLDWVDNYTYIDYDMQKLKFHAE